MTCNSYCITDMPFGAAFDGITDDTVAWNNALNWIANGNNAFDPPIPAGGGTLLLPKGLHFLNCSLS